MASIRNTGQYYISIYHVKQLYIYEECCWTQVQLIPSSATNWMWAPQLIVNSSWTQLYSTIYLYLYICMYIYVHS